jgi:hypothetical protein
MSRIAGTRDRMIELFTPEVADAPTRASKPHFVVSPRTAQGRATQEIAFTLIKRLNGAAVGSGEGASGGASGPGGGFQVTLWRAQLGTGAWASLAPFTTAAAYGEQYVIPDISGSWAIYIQIGGVTIPGRIIAAIAELD